MISEKNELLSKLNNPKKHIKFINEYKSSIFYFTQLSNGNIIFYSLDKEIKIIKKLNN